MATAWKRWRDSRRDAGSATPTRYSRRMADPARDPDERLTVPEGTDPEELLRALLEVDPDGLEDDPADD
jgi:hypothetical protein